ncbi:MAG: response regulator transcription factor [Pseudomonadota bacterium]
MRVLIVEDDASIAGNLMTYLESRGHHADWAANAAQALERLDQQDFEALVLDLGLPRVDGLRLMELLRRDWNKQLPVLMLTARDSEADKLAGFAAGADDYVVKPFSMAEVEARLLALLRRSRGDSGEVLRLGRLVELDTRKQVLRVAGEQRHVSPKVLRLLDVLLRDPGRVYSHAELEQALWGEPQEHSDNLRQLLYQARKVLRLPNSTHQLLQTKHGLGYYLQELP